jgi:uncharacterized membrane protein YkvA (DUF1232 family)
MTWVALIIALLVARPKGPLLAQALRLLRDVLRLFRRLAGDRSLPRDVRIRLWLVFGYLAIPIDLVPDFVPVLGYADDAIIVTAVLRSVVRRAGLEPIRWYWPGTEDGLAAFLRLCGLADQPDRSDRTEPLGRVLGLWLARPSDGARCDRLPADGSCPAGAVAGPGGGDGGGCPARQHG